MERATVEPDRSTVFADRKRRATYLASSRSAIGSGSVDGELGRCDVVVVRVYGSLGTWVGVEVTIT